METARICSSITALFLTGLLGAQHVQAVPTTPPDREAVSHNPVPARLVTNQLGASTGSLSLSYDVSGSATSHVRVTGGTPGDNCLVMCAPQQTRIATPWGIQRVPTTAAAIPGVFDATGSFAIPANFARPAFVGTKTFFQVSELGATPSLSRTMALSSLPGNAQPQLWYSGPPLEAVLLKEIHAHAPPRFQLLLDFRAPSNFVSVRVDSFVVAGSVSVGMVVLSYREGPSLGTVPLRTVIDLGSDPTPKIDINVAVAPKGSFHWHFFPAAVVDTRVARTQDDRVHESAEEPGTMQTGGFPAAASTK